MAHDDVPRLRLLRGDEAQLFRTYEVALHCAVRAKVQAPESLIEDACSFAWLQFLRCQPDRATAFPWLRLVAVRECWRLSRRERRDAHLEELPGFQPPAPDTVESGVEARRALHTLASLPGRQRRYLTLLVSGHSYDEITRHCDVTYTNVNKHLARARRTIRDENDDAC